MRAADFPYFDAPFLAFAHRGGATYPPNLGRENTVHAFRTAVDLGYRYLETDVHATADGVLVAFHDAVLDRVTGHRGRIGDLPYAAVREVVVGERDHIPTLAELLDTFPECRFNIDAKADTAVELLVRTVSEHRALDRVCVGAFAARRLRRLRRGLGPRVPWAASPIGVAVTRLAPWLSWAVRSGAPVLQVPATQPFRGRQIQVLTDGVLAAAHRAGQQVHVWTVDDAEQMNSLIDRGVDGIFTDRIDTLRSVLRARDRWVEP